MEAAEHVGRNVASQDCVLRLQVLDLKDIIFIESQLFYIIILGRIFASGAC